jgi:peptide/nickel transport system substrate-binding protein
VRLRSISRGARATAIVLVLVMLAAACGSSSKKGGGTTPASAGGIVGGNDTGTPVKGGSLVYGIEADTSGGYCLYKAQLAIGGIQVARAFYDTLTMPGQDGKIHPYLAQSVTPSTDYKTWTIKLRPGIKFHDNTDLTAAVVKENLDHYRNDNPLFHFVFLDISSITATDPLTVTVTTKVPWVEFPWFLWSSSRLGIMAKAQMESKDCNSKIIGTGPFMCQGSCWQYQVQTVATRNPNYWYKDPKTNQQLPYLDRITFKPQEDGPKRLSSLEAGDFTIIHSDDPLQILPIRNDVKNGKLKDTESDKWPEVSYLLLNATKEPFNHMSARQAFAYAVDRNAFNQARNKGVLQLASGPFAPGVPGYVADTGLPTFDKQKAIAAAQQYKTETGKTLEFTIFHTADTGTTLSAQIVQNMLQTTLGNLVKVHLNPVADQSTYINDAVARSPQAILWRNHPGADPDTQYVWWHCDNAPPAPCDNLVNFGGFNDPVINKDFDQARSEPDAAKRDALYQDINREFAKQLYDLWTNWILWVVAYKPTVHGILGPNLPDGSAPFEGLPTGHPVSGLWCDSGKC